MCRLQLAAHRVSRIDPGLSDPRLRLIDQRCHRLRLQVDAAANLVECVGRSLEQGIDRRFRPRRSLIDLCQCRAGPRFDFGQLRRQSLRRGSDSLVGVAGSFGQRPNLGLELRCLAKRRSPCGLQQLRHRPRRRLGPRQVLKQHPHVDPRGFRRPVERLALRRDPPRRSFKIVARRSKPHRRLVPKPHQLVADCLERAVILVDPLAKYAEQPLERLRFVAHRNDRAGEGFGFLAAGPAEHQPNQPEQRQRPSSNCDPRCQLGRRQRPCCKRLPRRPCAERKPRRREQPKRPAKHCAPTRAHRLRFVVRVAPIALVERRGGACSVIRLRNAVLKSGNGRFGAGLGRGHDFNLP